MHNPGASRRGNAEVCLMSAIARHLNCHRPPPGLAFGEPDDRLQRMIQYSRDVDVESRGRGVLDTRMRGV
jgi:hypothetical protein